VWLPSESRLVARLMRRRNDDISVACLARQVEFGIKGEAYSAGYHSISFNPALHWRATRDLKPTEY